MPAYTNEELRKKLVHAETLLRAVYREEGPRGGNLKPLPVNKFAKMTRKQVDGAYDFYHRHLMHRIAKALAL